MLYHHKLFVPRESRANMASPHRPAWRCWQPAAGRRGWPPSEEPWGSWDTRSSLIHHVNWSVGENTDDDVRTGPTELCSRGPRKVHNSIWCPIILTQRGLRKWWPPIYTKYPRSTTVGSSFCRITTQFLITKGSLPSIQHLSSWHCGSNDITEGAVAAPHRPSVSFL